MFTFNGIFIKFINWCWNYITIIEITKTCTKLYKLLYCTYKYFFNSPVLPTVARRTCSEWAITAMFARCIRSGVVKSKPDVSNKRLTYPSSSTE